MENNDFDEPKYLDFEISSSQNERESNQEPIAQKIYATPYNKKSSLIAANLGDGTKGLLFAQDDSTDFLFYCKFSFYFLIRKI